MEAQANDLALKALEERKKRIKELATLDPNHPFVLANSHMLQLSAQNSWNTVVNINMAGALWWVLSFDALLTPPHTVTFKASGGPDMDIALFGAALPGFFFVDPSTLKGDYNFSLQSVAGVVGEITFELYDKHWNQQIGSFAGIVTGISISKITGTGTLHYH